MNNINKIMSDMERFDSFFHGYSLRKSNLKTFFLGHKPTEKEKKLHRVKFLVHYKSGDQEIPMEETPNVLERIKNKLVNLNLLTRIKKSRMVVFIFGYKPSKQEEGVNKYNHLVNYLSQSETPYVSLEKPSILIRMKNSLIDGYNKVEAKFKKLFTKNKHTFSESNESKVDRTKLIDELMNASKKDKEND